MYTGKSNLLLLISFAATILLSTCNSSRQADIMVIETREKELDADDLVATKMMLAKHPDAVLSGLRVGQLRVFYNADGQKLLVRIEAVGLKVDNLLFIRGEQRNL